MKVKRNFKKMKNMTTRKIAAILSGLCLITSIYTQTEQPKERTTAEAAAAPKGELPIFSIDFPGGTPGELIQNVAKASGTKPNVIIPKYVAEVQIPKFKLQNVN